MTEATRKEALEIATIYARLLPPGVHKEALEIAIRSGQMATVRDALIGAKGELVGLGVVIDRWVDASLGDTVEHL